MEKLRKFVNQYFGWILTCSCFIGFLMPEVGSFTTYLIPIMLSIVIFSAYFQLDLTPQVLKSGIYKGTIYFFLRFVLIPVVAFYIFSQISAFWGTAMLLMTLLPAAVASPAFSSMFGGNVHLSLTNVLLSNVLSPFYIPLICSYFVHNEKSIDNTGMFITLALTVILPFIIHFPLRQVKVFSDTMKLYNPLISVFSVSLMFVFAVARYRHMLLDNLHLVIPYIFIAFLTFTIYYVVGWFLIPKSEKVDRITYSTSSGANNIGLGVTLTILYFPADINLFFIVSQLTWAFVLMPARVVFGKIVLKKREENHIFD